MRQQVASDGLLTEARNVVVLGPPATGKRHLATGLGIAAANPRHRVLLATATAMGHPAHRRAPRRPTIQRTHTPARYGLIIVDEVGYLPFE